MHMPLRVYTHEACLLHDTGPAHAERPERLRVVVDALREAYPHLDWRQAPIATRGQLLRVHSEHLLEAVLESNPAELMQLDPDTVLSPRSAEAALRAAGAAVAAVDAVMIGAARRAFCAVRPPGHHATSDAAMGFCLFNSIAVAARHAIDAHGLERVAVVDFDVHHGNGTQAIYYQRPDVLTISLHQEGCFPAGYGGAADRGAGAGEGCNLNIPLLPGGGHDAYLYAFERLVVPALARFRPQLIVVACGYDANAVDPLARMLAHSGTFRAMTARLRQVAEEFADGRLVLVHEGGYSEAYVPFCGQAVIEELAGVSTAVEDPLLGFIEQQQPNAEVRALQRRLLDRQAEDCGL